MTDVNKPVRSVYRYKIPVDDDWHTMTLSGPIVHVATRQRDCVEIWVAHGSEDLYRTSFRVFGTGQPLPDDPAVVHVGTAITPDGELVWHLFVRPDPQ